ncbi:MAG: hypothetical protein OXF50_23625 [Caldilineaceae bacterium]|nr:hypothetical protein [Caldilineaceae bacterium]
MKYPHPDAKQNGEIERKPGPWEQQPGEPLDQYRWFQIYLTRPQPRNLSGVAQTAGLPPRSRLVAKAHSQWNWEERAAACDRQGNALSGLLRDWRRQLLNEVAYVTRFIGLQDNARALANAGIANMDRDEARKHLGTLDRRQRGLLSLITPMKEIKESDVDEQELHWMIVERARDIYGEWLKPMLRIVYEGFEHDEIHELNLDDLHDPDSALSQRYKALEERFLAEYHQDLAPDVPAEILPWERQPAEPAGLFYLFRIYLSLMFLQSFRQVARMTRAVGESTPARIAHKWAWQERAVAFDAHLAREPLARYDLQHQLLQDKAYESTLDGLLQTTSALEKAEIGRLDRAGARKFLPLLARSQRSLLQQVSRMDAAAERESLKERRDVRLAALVEERALQQATEDWNKPDEILEKFYPMPDTAGDEKE